jgi:hypothetical protein
MPADDQQRVGVHPLAAAVFIASFISISAELFLGLVLGLKTWSHMVYLVISFALMGLGIGTTAWLLLCPWVMQQRPGWVLGLAFGWLAIATAAAPYLLADFPLTMSMLLSGTNSSRLMMVYVLVALPFVGVGFLLGYAFSLFPRQSGRLYFWDLSGAALGACFFFPAVGRLGPFHGCLVLAVLGLLFACGFIGRGTWPRRVVSLGLLGLIGVCGWQLRMPDPRVTADRDIGWEYIPGHFGPTQHQRVASAWHPLGRTDVYRIPDLGILEQLRRDNYGALQINLSPPPEFSYFTTNYRAGTPVYNYAPAGLAKHRSVVQPFSIAMEFPYTLLQSPRVLIIGTGGGRDILLARTHGAVAVRGAEVNPATFRMMSPGGAMYEYSGRIYTADGVDVRNEDGRHFVRTQPTAAYDLLVLNGVDTFAALASGAYAYAENYLYTKDALLDYLRVLGDRGMVNLNRWFEIGEQGPRETLRLCAMVLDALKTMGAASPHAHLIVGSQQGWGFTLVKKTPFTRDEADVVLRYFAEHGVEPVLSPFWKKDRPDEYDQLVAAFQSGPAATKRFIDRYWADISVVTDDDPFFYKYYRFAPFALENPHPASGDTASHVQFLILSQTVCFILVFMLLPLYVFRREGVAMPGRELTSFIIFFASIGLGFIFIEIALMQRLTLLLGSPIYSISVTLASLLLFAGAGSLWQGRWQEQGRQAARLVGWATALAVGYLVAFVIAGDSLIRSAVATPFWMRVGMACLIQAPIGVCLGTFFPAGLSAAGRRGPAVIAWAWGINFGFTVLGSTLVILIAQFLGFRTVFLMAAGLYVVAMLSFRAMVGFWSQAR